MLLVRDTQGHIVARFTGREGALSEALCLLVKNGMKVEPDNKSLLITNCCKCCEEFGCHLDCKCWRHKSSEFVP